MHVHRAPCSQERQMTQDSGTSGSRTPNPSDGNNICTCTHSSFAITYDPVCATKRSTSNPSEFPLPPNRYLNQPQAAQDRNRNPGDGGSWGGGGSGGGGGGRGGGGPSGGAGSRGRRFGVWANRSIGGGGGSGSGGRGSGSHAGDPPTKSKKGSGGGGAQETTKKDGHGVFGSGGGAGEFRDSGGVCAVSSVRTRTGIESDPEVRRKDAGVEAYPPSLQPASVTPVQEIPTRAKATSAVTTTAEAPRAMVGAAHEKTTVKSHRRELRDTSKRDPRVRGAGPQPSKRRKTANRRGGRDIGDGGDDSGEGFGAVVRGRGSRKDRGNEGGSDRNLQQSWMFYGRVFVVHGTGLEKGEEERTAELVARFGDFCLPVVPALLPWFGTARMHTVQRRVSGATDKPGRSLHTQSLALPLVSDFFVSRLIFFSRCPYS